VDSLAACDVRELDPLVGDRCDPVLIMRVQGIEDLT